MKRDVLVACTVLSAAVLGLVGCGSSAGPNGPPTGVTLPTPPPTTTTTTTTLNPMVVACGSPSPPPIYGVKIKVQTNSGVRKLVDSRPIVLNVDGYCAKVGQGGSARYCDTRLEGDLQREACDAVVMGKAKDTGRYGPTWTWEGRPCSSPGDTAGDGCVNHETNQFLVIGKGFGELIACAADEVPVAPFGSRCSNCVIDPDSPGCL